VSPPDASLGAAASKEEPLGPGVGADVEVTDDGMLRREVDGKEVVVPKDEVVMGVEEEAKGL
jgi:SIT4-associating protein SAP185/190